MEQPKPHGSWIHYSELQPFSTEGPCTEEYDTYRREVGRLIAEGHEGKHVLIYNSQIIGLFDSNAEAVAEGYRRYLKLGKPFFTHEIQTYERVLRAG